MQKVIGQHRSFQPGAIRMGQTLAVSAVEGGEGLTQGGEGHVAAGLREGGREGGRGGEQ